MDTTFVLRGNKSAHFSRPPDFALGPPLEVGLTQNPGGRLAKILTTNHFLFFKNISENILKKSAHYFVAPSHFTLYPKDVKFKVWLLKHEPWPLAGFLHDFSFLV